jgi:hypothetical protein
LNEVPSAPPKVGGLDDGFALEHAGVEWGATIDRRKRTTLYVRCANLEHFEQPHLPAFAIRNAALSRLLIKDQIYRFRPVAASRVVVTRINHIFVSGQSSEKAKDLPHLCGQLHQAEAKRFFTGQRKNVCQILQ